MKKQFLTGALAVGTLAIGSAILPTHADAATFVVNNCSQNVSDNVTNTVGCQYVTPPTNSTNDQGANGFDINDPNNLNPGFFGFSDWIQNDQYFDNVNAQAGSFDLDNLFFNTLTDWRNASNVLLLFKDGNNTSTFVGYLYDKTKDGSFSFTEPWNELFGKAKNVSHISVYYRSETTPIPTPALLPGAIGMGIAALRRKKREQGLEEATQEV